MLPEIASELFTLQLTGLALEAVGPSPVPTVAQPAASVHSSASPSWMIQRLIVCSCSFQATTIGTAPPTRVGTPRGPSMGRCDGGYISSRGDPVSIEIDLRQGKAAA